MNIEAAVIIRYAIQFALALTLFYSFEKYFLPDKTDFKFEQPKQSGITALFAIVISNIMMLLLIIAIAYDKSPEQLQEMSSNDSFSFEGVISQVLLSGIIMLPIIIALRLRNESWATIGISKQNLYGAISLGLGLCLIEIITNPDIKYPETGFQPNHFWGFWHFAVVGFAEEFMTRGYLQTRFMAWLGNWQGWIITSILMAVMHIPIRYFWQGHGLDDAILNSINLIPISLILGFVMWRTKNIAAPAILHLFVNYIELYMP